jgi:hypothetical protein
MNYGPRFLIRGKLNSVVVLCKCYYFLRLFVCISLLTRSSEWNLFQSKCLIASLHPDSNLSHFVMFVASILGKPRSNLSSYTKYSEISQRFSQSIKVHIR